MPDDRAAIPGCAASRFDSHPEDYEAECMNGLRLSGENMEFFARGRLGQLRSWWDRQGRSQPDIVVDYGCGIGLGTALIGEFFPESRVVGVDPSRAYVQRANVERATGRMTFETLEEFTGTSARSVDLVHVNGVVHHVEPAQRHAFFAACTAMLAPRGIFALFENNPVNPGARLVMRRISFDRDAVMVPPWEARRRLRDAGLDVVATRYLFFFPRPLMALRPLERHLVRLPLGAQYGVFAVRNGAGPNASTPQASSA